MKHRMVIGGVVEDEQVWGVMQRWTKKTSGLLS